jgi:Na+/phosphate symporter
MIVYLSLLVALIGLVVYAISTNPKAAEIGRLMFACGLLAFLLTTVPHLVAPLAARAR